MALRQEGHFYEVPKEAFPASARRAMFMEREILLICDPYLNKLT